MSRSSIGFGSGMALADQVVVSGSNVFLHIYLGSKLDQVSYGFVAVAWLALLLICSWQFGFVSLPMMNVRPDSTRERSQYDAAKVRQAFLWLTAGALSYWGVLLIMAIYSESKLDPMLLLGLGLFGLGHQVQSLTRSVGYAVYTPTDVFRQDMGRHIPTLAVLLIFMVYGGESFVFLLIAGALSMVAVLIGPGFRGVGKAMRVVPSKGWWRQDVAYSRWLVAGSLAQWSVGSIFVAAAVAELGIVAASVLRACQNLSAIPNVIYSAVENIAPRHATESLRVRGQGGLMKYILVLTVIGLGAAVVIGSPVLLAPALLLDIIYDGRYVGNADILLLYGVLMVLTYLGVPLRSGIRALGETQYVLWAYGAAACFATVVAVPLTAWGGLVGVVLGLILAQVLIQLILAGGFISAVMRRKNNGGANNMSFLRELE